VGGRVGLALARAARELVARGGVAAGARVEVRRAPARVRALAALAALLELRLPARALALLLAERAAAAGPSPALAGDLLVRLAALLLLARAALLGLLRLLLLALPAHALGGGARLAPGDLRARLLEALERLGELVRRDLARGLLLLLRRAAGRVGEVLHRLRQ